MIHDHYSPSLRSLSSTQCFGLAAIFHLVLFGGINGSLRNSPAYAMGQRGTEPVSIELVSAGPPAPPEAAPEARIAEQKKEEFVQPSRKETPKKARPRKVEQPPIQQTNPISSPSQTISGTAPGQSTSNGSALGEAKSIGAPDYLVNPPPPYPLSARRRKQEGLVLLLVHITSQGSVTELNLKASSGIDSLDNAALEAVKRWKFRPSTIAGMPVADVVEVPVRFSIKN